MGLHPVVGQMLAAMPDVEMSRAPLREQGRYNHECGLLLIRGGLRGAAWVSTVVHELVHAERGDQPCAHPVSEAQQELAVAKEAARRLIDIHRLADVAAAYPDDAHHVAEALDVDYDTLAVRMRWLHPAERHYLRRRMAAITGEEIA